MLIVKQQFFYIASAKKDSARKYPLSVLLSAVAPWDAKSSVKACSSF